MARPAPLHNVNVRKLINFTTKKLLSAIKLSTAHNAIYSNKTLMKTAVTISVQNISSHALNANRKLEAELLNNTKSKQHTQKDRHMDAYLVHYHLRKYNWKTIYFKMRCVLQEFAARAVGKASVHYNAVAIDFWSKGYYGDKNDKMVVTVNGQPGTKYGFKFLVATTTHPSVILDAIPVSQLQLSQKDDLVKQALTTVNRIFNNKKMLALMDREFCDRNVFSAVLSMGHEFLVPAKWNIVESAVREVDEGKRPSVSQYDYNGLQVWLIVVLRDENEESLRKKYQPFFSSLRLEPENASELYSGRWNVENGIRDKNYYRVRTSTKNYVIRVFFFMLMFILYNVWRLLNFEIHERLKRAGLVKVDEPPGIYIQNNGLKHILLLYYGTVSGLDPPQYHADAM